MLGSHRKQPLMSVICPDAPAWDAFVSAHPRAHVLQLSAWGELKSAFGWSAERVALTDAQGRITAGAQLLFKPLPFRLGTLAYLPMGGYVSDESQWDALWQAVRQTARRRASVLLKWEAGCYLEAPAPDFAAWGFRPSAQTVQPPNTIYVALDDDETMLARMNQGTRRKVRQSLKHNIRYYEAQASDVAKFTALMQATGARNAFGVHAPDYYALAYRLFVPSHAALILAEHEGDTLAGVMVFALGNTAWYLYGASADHKRNLMASYGVQWQAMQWARARGCRYYDMWGIPDAPEAELEAQFEARNDGLWGVYGFKRGWGGRVVRSVGAWDLPYRPLLYQAYQLTLRLRHSP